MTAPHRIAAIPGDGIGQEVMPEGLRTLQAAATRFGIALDITPIAWASCDHYQRTGQMMPDDWKAQIGGMDAILFGAVGWPDTVPDHISLWGSLLKFRREFDQYINLRPARLMPGVPCPLSGRKPGDIDMLIVRENTEGEYSSVGGVMFGGTEREFVLQESVFTRLGSERLLNYAFNLARSRARKHVTVATKSNGIAITMPYWDERVDAMAKTYPDVAVDRFHIDILTAFFVQRPQHFDVVVASNLFGDILSDEAAMLSGSIGMLPSASLGSSGPGLFEPIHGSAPDIARQDKANPMAMVLSAAMLLRVGLKQEAAALALESAVDTVLDAGYRTGDLMAPGCVQLGCQAMGEQLLAALEA